MEEHVLEIPLFLNNFESLILLRGCIVLALCIPRIDYNLATARSIAAVRYTCPSHMRMGKWNALIEAGGSTN